MNDRTPMSEYKVKVHFDRTGASYVDREELMASPRVQAQYEAARRIVKAYRAKQAAASKRRGLTRRRAR